MQRKKVLSWALLPLMLMTGCGSSSNSNAAESSVNMPEEPQEKSIVTLGDSISFGYGLENPEEERYSVLLKEKLEERDDITWNDYNYAISGDTSSDLLHRLQNGRAVRLPSADIIVIYIGANNILGVYTDYLKGIADEHQLDPETVTDEDIDALQKDIEERLQDKEALLQELDGQVEENLNQLELDMESIYNWIRERNENAEIYVLNIYNPYTDAVKSDLTEDAEFRTYAQERIDRANEILDAFTAAHSELIPVDIAGAFAACDPIPVIGMVEASYEENQAEGLDPHPNAEGQKLIAETLYDAMK
ncbi:MAG TPA: hypothetical protein DCG49_12455 [Ruminococcus sp.]|nr:hypothetical protein [Ruminococcus sp.]